MFHLTDTNYSELNLFQKKLFSCFLTKSAGISFRCCHSDSIIKDLSLFTAHEKGTYIFNNQVCFRSGWFYHAETAKCCSQKPQKEIIHNNFTAKREDFISGFINRHLYIKNPDGFRAIRIVLPLLRYWVIWFVTFFSQPCSSRQLFNKINTASQITPVKFNRISSGRISLIN